MYNILQYDPWLKDYARDIDRRMTHYASLRSALLGSGTLYDAAGAHLYFGIHPTEDGWVYREWAPGADAMYLTGDFCRWELFAHPMKKDEDGVFSLSLPGKDALWTGCRVQAVVVRGDAVFRRIPAFATRVEQDPDTLLWCCRVDDTIYDRFPWTDGSFVPPRTPYIYECHIGMAQERPGVGTYREFTENILPRIRDLGYNTVQIMAIMEHPYYGSFGYQVSSFFAPSSRFGPNRDLKQLIDTAHRMGIAVLLDVVHSHAVKNTEEGLSLFDGTEYQYFHAGERGHHSAWDTRLFDYGKPQVQRFLLSNLRYWLEVFHFDGFRFDGVTSMLYKNHGLGTAFTDYSQYFSANTDEDAVAYLQLANELVHAVRPRALTVAEDMSGMPGMCLPIADGGLGFDYRLSMGVPDLWIRWLKERRDEDWSMGHLWHELTSRRPREKSIGYCESHDQALVGDKTLMFRLCDAKMYTHMEIGSQSPEIDRGMALHKLLRLVTATLAGEGWLCFMGNEFGHPEWIDFPREGNGWSYHYCRRQWSLADNPRLRYGQLREFDRELIRLLKRRRLTEKTAAPLVLHEADKVMIYRRGHTVLALNFHPTCSFPGYFVPTPVQGKYQVVLSTDEGRFGGFDRADAAGCYEAVRQADGRIGFLCYLPCRAGLVFRRCGKSKA